MKLYFVSSTSLENSRLRLREANGTLNNRSPFAHITSGQGRVVINKLYKPYSAAIHGPHSLRCDSF